MHLNFEDSDELPEYMRIAPEPPGSIQKHPVFKRNHYYCFQSFNKRLVDVSNSQLRSILL